MAAPATFQLEPGRVSLAALRDLWRGGQRIGVSDHAWPGIDAAARTVAAVVEEGRTVYGVNTGFGQLARKPISADQIEELQRRLIASHRAGVGSPLPARVVRLALALKVNALAQGHSGVRREIVETLVALYNADATPVVPRQGSVGASGDLAPLAHLSAALLGEGEIHWHDAARKAGEVLSSLGLSPITLGAKEGLALLNGTQISTALALDALFRACAVFAAALASGAMSVDAALGSDTPFDPRIQEIRGQPGQIRVAAVLRDLLAGSEIRSSHLQCDRVQDPYSLRCQSQVMGAALDVMSSAAGMLVREANAVSDNPLVFTETGEILSGGNFHAEPVAFAADMLALAFAETGAISERRTALLTDASLSSLPAFLVNEPGLNSGFMIAHVVAAALVSENKQLSHPASVDSLPTSANQEDHVSMATHGAARLAPMVDNLSRIVGIELLAAAQGVDLRRPLSTSPRLASAHAEVRRHAPFLEQDRPFAPDIERVAALIETGSFLDTVFDPLQSL